VKLTRAWLVGAVATAALMAGCKPMEFRLISVPPPGRIGTLDKHEIRLSKGVALGIECIDPQDSGPHTCGSLRARSSDAAMARAFAADTDQLAGTRVAGRSSAQTERRSVFVVTGLGVGRAQIDVETSGGIESFQVQVLE
jgi:hypothetical protein